MKASLTRKGYYLNGSFTESDARDYILCHLTLSIAGEVSDDQGPAAMWEWLESRFGDKNRMSVSSSPLK
jgi:hypothetical protein